jgi:hypothetical protein
MWDFSYCIPFGESSFSFQIFAFSSLTPVILATQGAEISRIMVCSQPGQIVHETLFQTILSQKRGGRVAQGVGPEFKPLL